MAHTVFMIILGLSHANVVAAEGVSKFLDQNRAPRNDNGTLSRLFDLYSSRKLVASVITDCQPICQVTAEDFQNSFSMSSLYPWTSNLIDFFKADPSEGGNNGPGPLFPGGSEIPGATIVLLVDIMDTKPACIYPKDAFTTTKERTFNAKCAPTPFSVLNSTYKEIYHDLSFENIVHKAPGLKIFDDGTMNFSLYNESLSFQEEIFMNPTVFKDRPFLLGVFNEMITPLEKADVMAVAVLSDTKATDLGLSDQEANDWVRAYPRYDDSNAAFRADDGALLKKSLKATFGSDETAWPPVVTLSIATLLKNHLGSTVVSPFAPGPKL